jgi:hypothetical protein
MLYTFGFDRIGVLLSDVYVDDPDPDRGGEDAEHGVRLEVRVLDRGELKGSQYSAQPISVGQPIWRVDLLESVTGTPGSFDRTHHHPAFTNWEPGRRKFDQDLSRDPIQWLAARLSDLPGVLEDAGVDPDLASPGDVKDLRRAIPEILETTEELLGKVRRGQAGHPPAGSGSGYVRAGWL